MKMNNNTHARCVSVIVQIHEKVIVPSDYKETGLFHLKCRIYGWCPGGYFYTRPFVDKHLLSISTCQGERRDYNFFLVLICFLTITCLDACNTHLASSLS